MADTLQQWEDFVALLAAVSALKETKTQDFLMFRKLYTTRVKKHGICRNVDWQNGYQSLIVLQLPMETSKIRWFAHFISTPCHSSTTHSTNDGCLERYNHSKERTKKRHFDNTTSVDNIIQQSNDGNSVITPREQSENNEPDIDFVNNSDEDQKLKKSIPVANLVASQIQTDMTMVDIDLLTYRSTKNLSHDNFASEAFFQGDNEKVKFYTGLPGLAVVMVLFELIKPGLVVRNSLTKFQQFLLTLMRLRLNLSVQDLAYRFGVHASTVSRHELSDLLADKTGTKSDTTYVL
ncbi:Hypothetical predicted protein [Paramuricea clavata]|uniref:Transposase Helix-turn-helix domain-containing protein n=1 Tax=Paramuricea clavata TaxID=317549 RepID=A0A7D9J3D9_PARCT|nr:Hypothetical predicted protein [Paramuricea clavata]